MKPIRLGVLVSGKGTNLQALIDAIHDEALNAEIALVISNKPDAPALEKAKKAAIPCLVLKSQSYPSRAAYDKALAEKLLEKKVELVVLAGFMHILSKTFLNYFPLRVLNIHPSLLPDDPEKNEIVLPDGKISKVFRGKNAVLQALDSGEKWTGCSVHLVTEKVDSGPVLMREYVEILPGDNVENLHARIQKKEHRILPEGIKIWKKNLIYKKESLKTLPNLVIHKEL